MFSNSRQSSMIPCSTNPSKPKPTSRHYSLVHGLSPIVNRQDKFSPVSPPSRRSPVASPISCTHIQYSSSRSRSALLFNSDLSFLVSMLQPTGCPPQAFSRTSAVLCNQSHSRILLYPALSRHLVIAIDIRLVQPSLCLLVPHHVVLQISPFHRCHLSLSSYPLAPVAVVVVLYIYVTNSSIQASQEFSP
jgi:hypothetical protein